MQYTLSSKVLSSGKVSAENVRVVAKGAASSPVAVEPEILDGIVVRPLRNVNPDQAQYAGLVKLGGDSMNLRCSTLKVDARST